MNIPQRKELALAGHALAKKLNAGSDAPFIEVAKLVSDLSTQLDVTTAALREATKQRDAEHNDVLVWEKTMFKVCGEDGPKSVADKFASLEAQRDALAAENAALKSAFNPEVIPEEAVEAFMETAIMDHDWDDTGEWSCVENDTDVIRAVLAVMAAPETPATDAFLREVRAQARKDGAHFVANRMLAAWDAGFIEDTAKNAADIARMILTSTEFMADAPEGDFDRSFADGVLADIAAELRKGGAA